MKNDALMMIRQRRNESGNTPKSVIESFRNAFQAYKAYVFRDRAVALRHEQFLNSATRLISYTTTTSNKTDPWNRPDQSEHSYAASMR